VQRLLSLNPESRDDLWAVLDEPAPSDPDAMAMVDDPEALKDARSRLRRLLLGTHPDKFPKGGGEQTQAQAATQIIMRLMGTLDGMLALA